MDRSIRSRKVLFLLVTFVFCLVGSGYGVKRKFESRRAKREWARSFPLHALVMDMKEDNPNEVLRKVGRLWGELGSEDDLDNKPKDYIQDEMVKLVFDNIINPSPLHAAAVSGNLHWVQYRVAQGDNINSMGELNASPLTYAVRGKNEEIVEYFLRLNGIDVNGAGGAHPLENAALLGFMEIFMTLLDAPGINKNIALTSLIKVYGTKSYYPFLQKKAVSKSAQFEMIRILLEEGHVINPNFVDPDTQMNPLGLALNNGDSKLLKLLVKNNADAGMPQPGDNGYTPLIRAVFNNKISAIRLFFKNGANPNAPGTGGVTPLLVAVRVIQPAMVEFLIMQGADATSDIREQVQTMYNDTGDFHDRVKFKEILFILDRGRRWNILERAKARSFERRAERLRAGEGTVLTL